MPDLIHAEASTAEPGAPTLPTRAYYRFLKGTESAAYFVLLWLTWRYLDDELPWRLAIGATALSGAWWGVTFARMTHLLKTYFDVLSRLEFTIPATLGTLLAVFGIYAGGQPPVRIAAASVLVLWIGLCLRYRANRRRYVRQGHGPLPTGCWLSPPADALRPGDLILASGRVATHLRESVGHGETVVPQPAEALQSFSSYMDRGALIHPVAAFTATVRGQHGHYIVLRLRRALTAEQQQRAGEIARAMVDENRYWSERVNRRRRRILERLPLPKRSRDALLAAAHTSGYDWVGLFMGRLAAHRWTCIGGCLELYRRLGVQTDHYGTGLFGFGTTLFDPIMPVRLLSDPAFRVLSQADGEPPA